MSEYTPQTWEIKHAYVDTTEYVQRMEKDESRSLAEINAEFDRWLAQHDAEVAQAERKRVSDILSNRSAFWLNDSKRKDISLEQRNYCKDRAEILSNADALINWHGE